VCNGRFPHLRSYDREPCQEQSRTISLGASNSWFSLALSTLAVPNALDRLAQLVEEHWHVLGKVTSQQNIELLRMIGQLGHFSDVVEYPEIRRAPLSRKPATWVPAAEVRGEGIFIEFREDAVRAWINGFAQRQHERTFREAHMQWRRARHLEPPEAGYPGLRY